MKMCYTSPLFKNVQNMAESDYQEPAGQIFEQHLQHKT